MQTHVHHAGRVLTQGREAGGGPSALTTGFGGYPLHADAMRRLGRLRELVPALRTPAHDHPLDEWFHAQLVDALRLAGRRAEALDAYRALHRVLRDELGLEPSPDAQRLHLRLPGQPAPPDPSRSSRSSRRAAISS